MKFLIVLAIVAVAYAVEKDEDKKTTEKRGVASLGYGIGAPALAAPVAYAGGLGHLGYAAPFHGYAAYPQHGLAVAPAAYSGLGYAGHSVGYLGHNLGYNGLGLAAGYPGHAYGLSTLAYDASALGFGYGLGNSIAAYNGPIVAAGAVRPYAGPAIHAGYGAPVAAYAAKPGYY